MLEGLRFRRPKVAGLGALTRALAAAHAQGPCHLRMNELVCLDWTGHIGHTVTTPDEDCQIAGGLGECWKVIQSEKQVQTSRDSPLLGPSCCLLNAT